MPNNNRKKSSQKWEIIKSFFTPLEVPFHLVNLEQTDKERYMMQGGYRTSSLYLGGDNENEVHRRNEQRIELEKLEQEREVANLSLKAQHRLMIVTLVTALVALLSSATAVYISLQSKPPVVNITPSVLVKQ